MRNKALHQQLLRLVEKRKASARTQGPVSLLWRAPDSGLVDMQGAACDRRAIAGATRVVTYERYPSQQRFHASPAKFKGFSGPIGSGKSKALVHEAIRRAYLNPGVMGLIGAPTYRQLQDSTQQELITTLEEEKIPHRFLKADSCVDLLEPHSRIILRTLDNPERLRSTNLGWFGIDELTYCKEEAWTRLEGRLRDPKAPFKSGFAVWTPNGKDWVYRRFISEADRIGIYEAVRAAPGENRVLLEQTPDYYNNLAQSYPENFYRQEVLGEYLNMNAGSVYVEFSHDNIRPCSFDPRLPLIVALDFNVGLMAGALLQCETVGKRKEVRVLSEIVLPNSHTIAWCNEFLRRIVPLADQVIGLELKFYGDAAGGARQASSGGESNWTLLEKRMGAEHQYKSEFLYKRSNPVVQARVNAMNGMLCTFAGKHTSAGDRRLLIDPGCKTLIADLEDVVWKVDSHGNTYPEIDKTTHAKLTHISDAVGYYIETEHGFGIHHGMRKESLP